MSSSVLAAARPVYGGFQHTTERRLIEMFTEHAAEDYRTVAPGIALRVLCYGDRTMLTEFHLAAGHDLPTHSHPHEQTGYLVSGRIRLRIGDQAHEVSPGDSWCIAGGVEHGATIAEDSIAVEVFSPVREGYLPGVLDG